MKQLMSGKESSLVSIERYFNVFGQQDTKIKVSSQPSIGGLGITKIVVQSEAPLPLDTLRKVLTPRYEES